MEHTHHLSQGRLAALGGPSAYEAGAGLEQRLAENLGARDALEAECFHVAFTED